MRVWLVLCKNRNPVHWLVGRMIEKIDRVPYSHAAIAFMDRDGNSAVLEAVWPRSHKISVKDFSKTYAPVKVYELPEMDTLQLFNITNKLLGVRYEIAQLFLIAISNTWLWAKKHLQKEWNGKSGLICSELAAEFLTEAYSLQFNEDSDYISLHDLEDKATGIAKSLINNKLPDSLI